MISTFDISNLEETGRIMRLVAWTYRNDLREMGTWTLQEFFDYVKKIPYRYDPPDQEYIQRPAFTLRNQGDGGDCDDKAVVMMAYCYLTGIHFRILAVSRDARKPLHHVVLELYIQHKWVHVDATYPHSVFGVPLVPYQKTVYI